MIDPYNDFISEGGKKWDRLKGVAEASSMTTTIDSVPDIIAWLALCRHRELEDGAMTGIWLGPKSAAM